MEATDRLAMIEATAPLAFALFGWRALRANRKVATSCRPVRLVARGSRRSSVDPQCDDDM